MNFYLYRSVPFRLTMGYTLPAGLFLKRDYTLVTGFVPALFGRYQDGFFAANWSLQIFGSVSPEQVIDRSSLIHLIIHLSAVYFENVPPKANFKIASNLKFYLTITHLHILKPRNYH